MSRSRLKWSASARSSSMPRCGAEPGRAPRPAIAVESSGLANACYPKPLRCCRYPEQRAEASTRHCRDIRAGGIDIRLHGQSAAGTPEHRHNNVATAASIEGHPDHHGHRLDRPGLQPASAGRSVAGQCRDQFAGAAQFVPAGARSEHLDRIAVGARHHAAGVGRSDQSGSVHRHLQDPARGVVDG